MATYQKLVRDKIPDIIISQGKTPKIHIASNKEYFYALKNKLKEEVSEFINDENGEEIADILEVIYAICHYKKYKLKDIEKIRIAKFKSRGGFSKKIILDSIS